MSPRAPAPLSAPLLIADVASYQGVLRTEDVQRAGFAAINLKVSHGLTQRSVHPDAAGWVARCRERQMGLCSFHFLDGSAPGAQQAGYAYAQMQDLGLTTAAGHQVDCESTATEAIVRDYVATMHALLGRQVVLYTGDWWWAPRGWHLADLTPYLWSAPNVGYLTAYPGNDSTHWSTVDTAHPNGYGGWRELAVMQYAVAPLFYSDGTTGTIKVSKSAIRDLSVWAGLTGGDVLMTKPDPGNAPPEAWTVPLPEAEQADLRRRLVNDTGVRAHGLVPTTVRPAAGGPVGHVDPSPEFPADGAAETPGAGPPPAAGLD